MSRSATLAGGLSVAEFMAYDIPDGKAELVRGELRMTAPDLAVEIISPSETRARIAEKLDDYRVSSVPLVWLIDPRKRVVTIIEGGAPPRVLSQADLLDGGTVIPGFSCLIRDLFKGLAASRGSL